MCMCVCRVGKKNAKISRARDGGRGEKESRKETASKAKEICKRKRGKLQTLRQSSCLSAPLSALSVFYLPSLFLPV